MGKDMDNSLEKPNKLEDKGIMFDLNPKLFYPDKKHLQSIKITDGTPIYIEYDDVLPHISVRKTKYE